jgi:hypothetical protein
VLTAVSAFRRSWLTVLLDWYPDGLVDAERLVRQIQMLQATARNEDDLGRTRAVRRLDPGRGFSSPFRDRYRALRD